MKFLNKYNNPKNIRFKSFEKTFKVCLERNHKTIVETGTARGKTKFFFIRRYNWKDGMSTMIFSDYAKFELESLISGISSESGSAHSFYGNMQDKLAVNNLIATTLNKFDKVDILVNANRTIIPSNPLDEKDEALEKSLSQNLIATLNVSQLFAQSVIKQTKNRKNSERSIPTKL